MPKSGIYKLSKFGTLRVHYDNKNCRLVNETADYLLLHTTAYLARHHFQLGVCLTPVNRQRVVCDLRGVLLRLIHSDAPHIRVTQLIAMGQEGVNGLLYTAAYTTSQVPMLVFVTCDKYRK